MIRTVLPPISTVTQHILPATISDLFQSVGVADIPLFRRIVTPACGEGPGWWEWWLHPSHSFSITDFSEAKILVSVSMATSVVFLKESRISVLFSVFVLNPCTFNVLMLNSDMFLFTPVPSFCLWLETEVL